LLFTEANHGDLQRYLDNHSEDISESLRLKWCLKAAEAIAYIHSKGVIHSDLRPENFLLHVRDDGLSPELLLCDFGGSYCKIGDKVIDGGHLPDTGFFNPNSEWASNRETDIFALGSIFYIIMTGHWPYKSPGPFVDVEEWEEYDEKVNELFMNTEFPPVGNLVGGDIILDCWTEKIRDAGVIVARYEALLQTMK
jgi:serine/threonine protein kinase